MRALDGNLSDFSARISQLALLLYIEYSINIRHYSLLGVWLNYNDKLLNERYTMA